MEVTKSILTNRTNNSSETQITINPPTNIINNPTTNNLYSDFYLQEHQIFSVIFFKLKFYLEFH